MNRLAWMDDAACREHYREIFYPEDDMAEFVWSAPRLVCMSCPVRIDCLSYAVANKEDYGMWGGKTPTERKRSIKAAQEHIAA